MIKNYFFLFAALFVATSSIAQNSFPNSGNVGVGTANPINGLHIFSYNDFDKGSVRISYSGSEDAVLSFGGNGVDRDIFKITKFPHNSTTGGTNLFTIDAINGNTGIGTSTPDAKLTVNGTVHAKEVRVDLNVPGADYVFEKSYPLRPLAKVSKYISVNHHLPDMPSAKSMEQNGIDVSGMNMKLLQKVEELTLYLIEMKKENELLNKRLRKVENRK